MNRKELNAAFKKYMDISERKRVRKAYRDHLTIGTALPEYSVWKNNTKTNKGIYTVEPLHEGDPHTAIEAVKLAKKWDGRCDAVEIRIYDFPEIDLIKRLKKEYGEHWAIAGNLINKYGDEDI